MRTFFLTLIFFSGVSFCQSQNLVPNGDFEDTLFCPVNISGMYGEKIYALSNWFPVKESPDYFNNCSPFTVATAEASVPINGFGYQAAHSGNGYIGIYTFGIFATTNYREYVGVQLTQPLTMGTKYYFQMFVSCAMGGNQDIQAFSNNIGFKLGNIFFESQANPLFPDDTSHFHISSILTDTLNWISISTSIIPDSAYNYLYLGNFYNDINTDSVHVPGTNGGLGAYYYIDDVLLTTDSTMIVGLEESHKLNSGIFLYPNPATNQINVYTNQNIEVEIFSLLGKNNVSKTLNKGLNNIDVSQFPDGVYIINTYKHSTKFIIKH